MRFGGNDAIKRVQRKRVFISCVSSVASVTFRDAERPSVSFFAVSTAKVRIIFNIPVKKSVKIGTLAGFMFLQASTTSSAPFIVNTKNFPEKNVHI